MRFICAVEETSMDQLLVSGEPSYTMNLPSKRINVDTVENLQSTLHYVHSSVFACGNKWY